MTARVVSDPPRPPARPPARPRRRIGAIVLVSLSLLAAGAAAA